MGGKSKVTGKSKKVVMQSAAVESTPKLNEWLKSLNQTKASKPVGTADPPKETAGDEGEHTLVDGDLDHVNLGTASIHAAEAASRSIVSALNKQFAGKSKVTGKSKKVVMQSAAVESTPKLDEWLKSLNQPKA